MNLKQWQRNKKIKAEAEAAAKRTVERVLNAVKEPAMSEFKAGDRVLRHFNKKVYFVNHRVGDEEYLISYEKDTPVSKCQICEHFSNLKLVAEPDLGDDFPIENHISPNCQSRDV